MLIVGIRVCYRGTGTGTFHCQRCGGDRPYRRRSGRRWVQLLQIPVVPLGTTGEHLRCVVCRTCYRAELLAVPTTAQMQVALLAATTAAALTMLQAGDAASPAARRKAADLIRSAGSRDYSRAGLASDVDRRAPPPGASPPPCASQPPSASQLPGMRQPPGMSQLPDISEGPSVGQGQSASEGQNVAGDLEPALRTFALQLEVYAREWFLANVVRDHDDLHRAGGLMLAPAGYYQSLRLIPAMFGGDIHVTPELTGDIVREWLHGTSRVPRRCIYIPLVNNADGHLLTRPEACSLAHAILEHNAAHPGRPVFVLADDVYAGSYLTPGRTGTPIASLTGADLDQPQLGPMSSWSLSVATASKTFALPTARVAFAATTSPRLRRAVAHYRTVFSQGRVPQVTELMAAAAIRSEGH